MKLILFISTTFYVCSFSLFNVIGLKSEKKEINFNTIRTEIEWFIEKVKPESYMHGKHNVYIVKIFEEDNGEKYCFTVGYIDNPLLMKYINEYKYYTHIKEDLIILDYSNDLKTRYLLKNTDCIMPLVDKRLIIDKIDMEMVGIGTWPGYVCCYEKGNIKKMFYENSDEISSAKSIFKIPPPTLGTIIEVDSSSFKQMLKSMQKKPIK